jgi:hypothetical protein
MYGIEPGEKHLASMDTHHVACDFKFGTGGHEYWRFVHKVSVVWYKVLIANSG